MPREDLQVVPVRASGLEQLEVRIQRCLDGVVELGALLTEVEERRLYEAAGYRTFPDYCWGRWRISRYRAYQLQGAAEVASNLKALGDVLLPANERQFRALARLEPEDQLLVWQAALEDAQGEQPAAAQIARRVAERLAALSDEQQLEFVRAHEGALAARARAARPVNWPGRLNRMRRNVELWLKARPGRAERFGPRLREALQLIDEMVKDEDEGAAANAA